MTESESPIHTTTKGQDMVVFADAKTGLPRTAWCLNCSKEVLITIELPVRLVPKIRFGLHECVVV